MTTDTESVIARIHKLMSLKEGAQTEAEALNAATRIAEITKRYNLDIGVIELERNEVTASSELSATFEGNLKNHVFFLASACGILFDVKHYSEIAKKYANQKKTTKIIFYGLKANVSSASLTFNYLLASCETTLVSYRKTNKVSYGDAHAFRIGFGRGIYQKVKEHSGKKKEYTSLSNEENAIVLIGNKLIKEHAQKLGLKTTSINYNCNTYSEAYGEGYNAGQKTDLFGKSKLLA